VLLVVAMATIAAAEMTRQGQLDRRRTGNRIALEQAYQVALGGERWAIALLARDRRGNAGSAGSDQDSERPTPVDARDEIWARDLPPIPIEGGQVAGQIDDAQARLNINNLTTSDGIDAVALARLQRLLAALELEPKLAQAIVDWVDSDSETTYPRGAEDGFYGGLESPYRAANREIATASELRLVRGIDAAAWRALEPHVTALPGGTSINVNTAKPEVLQTLAPELSLAAAKGLYERAGEDPFTSIQAFTSHPLLRGLEVTTDRLGIGSRHFRMRADVEMGPIRYTLYSWLRRRDDGRASVLRRSRTPS
jgi:general secretion pathway protein K